jgi:hypothetical protein
VVTVSGTTEMNGAGDAPGLCHHANNHPNILIGD